MTGEFWDLTARLRYHYWYRERERFLLAAGTFDCWVMLSPEEGRFRYELPDLLRGGEAEGEATFGDVLICPPGHLLRRRILGRMTYHVIAWSFFGPQGGQPADPAPGRLPTGKITLRDVDRLSSDYAALRAVQGRVDAQSAARRVLLLSDILHLCHAQQTAAETDTPRPDAAMAEAARQIRMRAREPFSMREVSDALGLSPVQFTRRFRAAHDGMTPSAYLAAVRLHRARDLLLETDLTLQAIAEQCGYSSGLYLSRVFTRAMKQPPGRFRHAHRL